MELIHKTAIIHPSSIIDEGSIIGANTRIWHWVHVSKGARIGSNCTLGQNVYISKSAIIGNGVKIQNNVSIFDEVTIEDNVFCGPSMVFTNVRNPRSRISRKKEYKKTLIKEGATLGANCTIVCGITVGEYAFIGAGAVVSKNIKKYALEVGVPSSQIGWMSEYGERIPLPLSGHGKWKCQKSSTSYILIEDDLKKI